MNTKIAESSKVGSTRILVVEYGGSRYGENKEPETIGYEVCEERDLLLKISYIHGSKFKMNIVKRFFRVYELGPQIHDTASLRLLEDNHRKDIRYQEFLELKKEFEPYNFPG